jgi:SPP1 gp7 family putative phage head morphogenesis protein
VTGNGGVVATLTDVAAIEQAQGFAYLNSTLITNISDRAINDVSGVVLDGYQKGLRASELAEKIRVITGKSLDRAEFIARDQIGSLNGQVNAARQQALGAKRFFWRTVGDDRVRDEHRALDNGKSYSYDDPPDGLPGEPPGCRCNAEMDLEFLAEK